MISVVPWRIPQPSPAIRQPEIEFRAATRTQTTSECGQAPSQFAKPDGRSIMAAHLELPSRKGPRMTLEALKKDVASAIDSMRDELLGMSHAIHQEPELALEEFKAAARLTEAVRAHDIDVQSEAFGLK